MDSFTTSQKTKPRKTKRLAKKSRVQMVLDNVSRAIETIVVLVTVAKLCYQLAVTFQDSGVATVILANRNLAFLVGNAIVITLLANSSLLLNQEVVNKRKSVHLYEEFVRESSRREGLPLPRSEARNRAKQSEAENVDKQSITEARPKQSEAENETQSIPENRAEQSISDQAEGQIAIEKKAKKSISEKRVKHEKLTEQSTSVKKREQQSIVEPPKKMEKQNLAEERQQIQSYQRSKSENLEGLKKRCCGRLRRSETDASSERFDSDDELRCKIESFIAKQRRNQNDD